MTRVIEKKRGWEWGFILHLETQHNTCTLLYKPQKRNWQQYQVSLIILLISLCSISGMRYKTEHTEELHFYIHYQITLGQFFNIKLPEKTEVCCHICTFYWRCCSQQGATPVQFLLQLVWLTAVSVKIFHVFLCLVTCMYTNFSICKPLNPVAVHCDFLTCRLGAIPVHYTCTVSSATLVQYYIFCMHIVFLIFNN